MRSPSPCNTEMMVERKERLPTAHFAIASTAALAVPQYQRAIAYGTLRDRLS